MCTQQKHYMYLLGVQVLYPLYFVVHKTLASNGYPSIYSASYLVGVHCTSKRMNVSNKRQGVETVLQQSV